MNSQCGRPSKHMRLISAKAAYSKAARKRLIESRAKLDGIRAAIKHAIVTGRLESSEQLVRAQRAMEARLTIAESRLNALRKSSEEEWEPLRDDLDNAWEDLSYCIKKLVTRYSNDSK